MEAAVPAGAAATTAATGTAGRAPSSAQVPWMITVHLDSVVFDSVTVWDRVARAVLAERAVTAGDRLPDPLVLALATGKLRGISDALSHVIRSRTGASVTSTLIRLRIFHLLSSAVRDTDLARPGAGELLTRIAATDARIAYLSSMPRTWVETLDTHLGLPEPHVLLTTEQLRSPRPDPYGHLLASHQLGVPARLGVALESGSDGISAALTAGLRVIAVVPKDMTGGTDRLTLVSDLRDVDLAAAREALCADRALSRGPAGSALGDTA